MHLPDPDTHALRPFDRRALPPQSLLDVWPAADGWPLRRFCLGTGTRGRLLFLGGRGDMVEKYIESMAHWAARGWQVTSFDWRGQGGSGQWASGLSTAPDGGHRRDFAMMVEDLSAFHAAWRQGAGPHVIVAHSMGGHIVLRAIAQGLLAPDAVVLVAPMLGLNTAPIPARIAPLIARAMCALGLSGRAAWRDDPASPLRQARLTHSAARLDDELWWRDQAPALYRGAPSWGWLAQAFASTRDLERSGLERVRVPMFVLATDADRLVSPAAIRRVTARLPDAHLHMYGQEAAHEILREVDAVREDALRRIDDFLDERAPAA
ncbi:alpha/beta hydrolase [soil metagenome]